MEDVQANIESRDSDLDVDEQADFNTLRADDTDTETVTFSVPDDLTNDDYDVDVTLVGTDENGARHGDHWLFTLDIEVPRDEVTITNFELMSDTISCNENRVSLDITLENTGRDDQDDISIFVDSSKLDLMESVYNIQLDEADSTTKTFDLTLPKNLTPGNYFIQIIANVNSDDETDREAAQLTVETCQPQQPPVTPPEEEDQEDTTDVNVIQVPPTGGVIYGKPTQTDFFSSSAYIVLLGVLIIVGFLLFLILLVVLLKR
jgi:uncharacterized membrane protein